MNLEQIKARLGEFSEVEILLFLTFQGKKGRETIKGYVTGVGPEQVTILSVRANGPRRPVDVRYDAIQAIRKASLHRVRSF